METLNSRFVAVFALLFITTGLYAQTPLPALEGPFGGRVTALAAQPNKLYASLWPGGVYRTTDEGLNWTHMNLPGDKFGNALTVFADSQNVFASTWNGLFQSSDGGDTWQKRPVEYVTAVAALSSGYIALRRGDTVCISDASGQNWTNVYVFTPTDQTSWHTGILVDKDTVYLGSNSRGIYKSYDGGHSWVACNNGFVPGTTFSFFKNHNRIYVSSNTGIYYTDNHGANWTVMTTHGLAGCLDVQSVYCYRDSIFTNAGITPVVYDSAAVWWLPSNRQCILSTCYQEVNGRLFCGTMDGVYAMQQDFNHWEERTHGMKGTSPAGVLVNGSKLLACPFTAMCQSPDSGRTWTTLANDLPLAHFSGLVAYIGDTIIAGGGVYSSMVYYTTDTFKTYTTITDTTSRVPSGAFYIKSINRFLVFVKDTPGSLQHYSSLFYTDDWGGSWHQSTGVPVAWPAEGLVEAGPDLYLHYTYPMGTGMYKSSDNGASWSRVNTYGHADWTTGWAYLDSTVYFAGDYDGVFWSSDRGATWDSLAPINYVDVILSLIAANGEIYGTSFWDLYKLDRVAHVWNKVATIPDHSLTLWGMYQQGNRLLISTNGGPILYYDIPAMPTSVPVVLKPLNMLLYPNPSSTEPVHLSVDNEMLGGKLDVYDATGKLVYQTTITSILTSIPVSGFSAGTYVAAISNGEKQVTKKFVVR